MENNSEDDLAKSIDIGKEAIRHGNELISEIADMLAANIQVPQVEIIRLYEEIMKFKESMGYLGGKFNTVSLESLSRPSSMPAALRLSKEAIADQIQQIKLAFERLGVS